MDTYQDPLAAAVPIRGYLDAKEVLNDASRFSQASKRESAEFVGGTVLTLEGDEHFERRRLLSRLMRRRALVYFDEQIIAPTVRVVLDEELAISDRVDLVRFGRRVFLQLAASMIGLKLPLERTDRVLEQNLFPLIEAVTVEWSRSSRGEIRAKGRAAMQSYVTELVQPSIEERRRVVASGGRAEELPTDLLSLMVLDGLPDPVIHREAVLFLVASTLNNAATLTHAIDETDRWLRTGPKGIATSGDEVITRIVHETLRYCVVTPAVFRECRERTTLSSGTELRAGDMVAVMLPEANQDEAVWGPDAETFDPLRSLPIGEKPYGLAFGAGVHACLGRPLVLGSYSEELTAGMLSRILHQILLRGAVVDHGADSELAASDQRRFERFPIRFERPSFLASRLGIS
jgi:cytochrome P450